MIRFTTCFAIALVISGCSTTPLILYQEPTEQVPVATITHDLRVLGMHTYVKVNISGGDQCRDYKPNRAVQTLYTLNSSSKPPAVSTKVAALQPVRFSYSESSNYGSCDIAIDTFLLPNRNYALKGGQTYISTGVSIFGGEKGSSACTLKVVDIETNEPVPSIRSQGSICALMTRTNTDAPTKP